MGKPIHIVLYSVLFYTLNAVFFIITVLAYAIQAIVKHLVPASYRFHKSLDGEVVLVTGGGGGLGKLLAIRLAKQRAIVVLWDINMKGVDETVKLVESTGGKCYGYQCDLSNREDVYRVAALTEKEVGQVSILINNAGMASGKYFLDTPDYMIEKTFEVNILAHFWRPCFFYGNSCKSLRDEASDVIDYMHEIDDLLYYTNLHMLCLDRLNYDTTKAFLPSMIEKDHGHIVTIASMAGYVGISKLVDYCSSKFAAVGFDEALRIELEAKGIKGVKTTVISPYFLQATGMFDNVNSLIPTLKANDVADNIIDSIRRNDKYVLLPSLLRYLLMLRWLMPWKATSLFLRGLVPDAAPSHPQPGQIVSPSPSPQPKLTTLVEKSSTADVALHHRITTASERKP